MNESKHQLKIEKLNINHLLTNFDSGQLELNNYLKKYALVNQQANSAQTYVATYNGEVIGYYSLVVGSVSHQEAPKRVKKGQAQYPIPVLILARLAVTQPWQKQGIGKGLLKDALQRTAQAANLVGIRALLVHAKNTTAKQWYERFDFTPSPTDELHLFLLLKDINKILTR